MNQLSVNQLILGNSGTLSEDRGFLYINGIPVTTVGANTITTNIVNGQTIYADKVVVENDVYSGFATYRYIPIQSPLNLLTGDLFTGKQFLGNNFYGGIFEGNEFNITNQVTGNFISSDLAGTNLLNVENLYSTKIKTPSIKTDTAEINNFYSNVLTSDILIGDSAKHPSSNNYVNYPFIKSKYFLTKKSNQYAFNNYQSIDLYGNNESSITTYGFDNAVRTTYPVGTPISSKLNFQFTFLKDYHGYLRIYGDFETSFKNLKDYRGRLFYYYFNRIFSPSIYKDKPIGGNPKIFYQNIVGPSIAFKHRAPNGGHNPFLIMKCDSEKLEVFQVDQPRYSTFPGTTLNNFLDERFTFFIIDVSS